MEEMTNADLFQREFGIYATELWAMPEKQFLAWLNAPCDRERPNNMPSARKKGKWIWDENGMDWGLGAWCCSECGSKPETWWESDKRNNPLRCSGGRFCGNCGAKMEASDHGDD